MRAHVAQDDLIHNHERLLTFENLTELPGPLQVRVKSLAFIAGKKHMDISRKMADEILDFDPVKIHDQSSLSNISASMTHHKKPLWKRSASSI